MEKTGESYTAARTALLTPPQKPRTAEKPPLATSDLEIRRRTGRGWEEWFDLLDEWGAAERTHRKRKATKPTSAHFDRGDDGIRVHVTFTAKGEDKSTATLSHERLAHSEERDRMKAYWRDRTAALKQELER
jgi:hypothetical protein